MASTVHKIFSRSSPRWLSTNITIHKLVFWPVIPLGTTLEFRLLSCTGPFISALRIRRHRHGFISPSSPGNCFVMGKCLVPPPYGHRLIPIYSYIATMSSSKKSRKTSWMALSRRITRKIRKKSWVENRLLIFPQRPCSHFLPYRSGRSALNLELSDQISFRSDDRNLFFRKSHFHFVLEL